MSFERQDRRQAVRDGVIHRFADLYSRCLRVYNRNRNFLQPASHILFLSDTVADLRFLEGALFVKEGGAIMDRNYFLELIQGSENSRLLGKIKNNSLNGGGIALGPLNSSLFYYFSFLYSLVST